MSVCIDETMSDEISYWDAVKANKYTLAGYSMMAAGGSSLAYGLASGNLEAAVGGGVTTFIGFILDAETFFGRETYDRMERMDEELRTADDPERKLESIYRTHTDYCHTCTLDDLVEMHGLEDAYEDIKAEYGDTGG